MIFDAVSYLKEVNRRVEIYQIHVFNEITKNNPDWIKKIQEEIGDKTLTKEEADLKAQEIINNEEFIKYSADWDMIKEIFTISEEQLLKYKIDEI